MSNGEWAKTVEELFAIVHSVGVDDFCGLYSPRFVMAKPGKRAWCIVAASYANILLLVKLNCIDVVSCCEASPEDLLISWSF